MYHYPQNAVEQLQAGNIEGAISILETNVAANVAEAGNYHLLGMLYLQINQLPKAYENFKKTVALESSSAIVHLHLGHAEAVLGMATEAIHSYRRALEIESDMLDGYLALGRALTHQGKHGEAVSTFYSGLEKHKDNQALYNELRQALKKVEHSAETYRFKNLGAILLVGMGHSGCGYLVSELTRRLGVAPRDGLRANNNLGCWITTENLDKLIEQGGIVCEHLEPSEENLLTLHVSGIRKVVVQVRDPRQAIFSMTHWNDRVRERATNHGESKYELPIMIQYLGSDYFSLPFEQKLDRFIDKEGKYWVDWIQKWLEVSEDPKWNFRVKLTKFEDMKRDYASFFYSVLDFLEIDRSEFKGEEYQSKQWEQGYRKGLIDEWRDQVTPKQRQRFADLVPNELLIKMGWEI